MPGMGRDILEGELFERGWDGKKNGRLLAK